MNQVREIRCSSLDRYMNCPGFAQMTDLTFSESGPAAEEGTAAGELLQAMLTQRSLKPNVKAMASNGVRFDSDMYYHLTPIAQELLSKNVLINCEQRVDWVPCAGIAIRGQFDIQYTIGETLYIEDLKYGWKIVDVKENWQLLGYAIGKFSQLSNDPSQGLPKNISLTIHQPRPHHEEGSSRTWVISRDTLADYYQMIAKVSQMIVNGDRTLITGKHCRYCPAAANRCPALNKALYNGINEVMYDFQQDDLTDKDISDQLNLLADVASLTKIKYDALEALACSKMREGRVIPGYGFEEKLGDREWKAEITAEAIETLTGINIKDDTLLSPAKAEKLGVSKSLVAGLTQRVFKGVKAVKKDFTKDAEKVFGKK